MVISSLQKKANINVTTCRIELKTEIKFLGVFIDSHLKWNRHISHVKNKISKNLGILFKQRHYVPLITMKQLYHTLVSPYLNYGLMSWGTAAQSKLKAIETTRNKCVRSIFFAKRDENAIPFHFFFFTLYSTFYEHF